MNTQAIAAFEQCEHGEFSLLKITCKVCKTRYNVTVDAADLIVYKQGNTLIQDAFPYLTQGGRELIISQICEPCFDRMFSE